MQLQAHLKDIEATGTQVIGVSYDSLEVLSQFARKQQITFPLLSDTRSKTITDYGLLNTEAKGRAEGVPHPATVLIDRQGIIRAKLFLEGYRDRHAPEELVKAAEKVE